MLYLMFESNLSYLPLWKLTWEPALVFGLTVDHFSNLVLASRNWGYIDAGNLNCLYDIEVLK